MAENTISKAQHILLSSSIIVSVSKLKEMLFFLFQCVEKSIIRSLIRGELFTDFAKKREISSLSCEVVRKHRKS